MRVTLRTELAMRTLMFCAANNERLVRKREIAEVCKASENHLAQVIHVLGQRGFLTTLRGRAGGLRLARPADQITVGEVFRSLEGEVPFAECFGKDDGASCPLRGFCKLHCLMAEAVEAFFARLDQVTLAELMEDNAGLHALLRAA